MNTTVIAAIVAGIPVLATAIVSIIVALKSNNTANGAINSANAAHQRLNDFLGSYPASNVPEDKPSVKKDPI